MTRIAIYSVQFLPAPLLYCAFFEAAPPLSSLKGFGSSSGVLTGKKLLHKLALFYINYVMIFSYIHYVIT